MALAWDNACCTPHSKVVRPSRHTAPVPAGYVRGQFGAAQKTPGAGLAWLANMAAAAEEEAAPFTCFACPPLLPPLFSPAHAPHTHTAQLHTRQLLHSPTPTPTKPPPTKPPPTGPDYSRLELSCARTLPTSHAVVTTAFLTSLLLSVIP